MLSIPLATNRIMIFIAVYFDFTQQKIGAQTKSFIKGKEIRGLATAATRYQQCGASEIPKAHEM